MTKTMLARRDDELLRTIRNRRQPQVNARLEVLNAAGPVATIRIYDYLDFLGITAEDVAAQLDQITAPEIEVQINSPGGDVFEGIAIYNALRAHSARITTRVDGIAASAASVVVQAGDHRVMLSAGQLMIHEAWGMCVGPAGDMRAFADLLDQQNEVLAGIYANRSGRPVEEMRQLMADETWLTDAQAVEAALADEVVEPKSQATKKDDSNDDANAAVTVTVNGLVENPEAIAAAIRAALAPQIPDALAAPGVTPPDKDGEPNPDAAPAASETDLLHALRGALTPGEPQ